MANSDEALTVQKIIAKAGGAEVVAAKITETLGKDIGHWAVFKWYKTGIPRPYWNTVRDLSGCTIEEIFAACEAASASTEAAE